jgi:glucosamine--fructose-6-phosphate aminotransferase (isomerizing)
MMCGIFGAASDKPVVDALIEGLKRLEYRGYDSAGLATIEEGGLNRVCAVGHVAQLEAKVGGRAPTGTLGIAHTRWATHGEPSDRNAHPHVAAGVAVAHNGIVENYRDLRSSLSASGCTFRSETDTEVIPWLIGREIEAGVQPEDALQRASSCLEGSYAVVAMTERDPSALFAMRKGSPLTVGLGEDGAFLASDPNALAGYARTAVMLEDGDSAVIRRSDIVIRDAGGKTALRRFLPLETSRASLDKGHFAHHMLKEIHEQPKVCANVLRAMDDTADLAALLSVDFARVSRLRIVACGSSFYAGLVAKRWFEQLAQLPCEVSIASEMRYDPLPPAHRGEAAILISQSGETADTLGALDRLKHRRTPCIALVNQTSSTLARNADCHVPLRAGPEIGVASTKAFVAQLLVLARLALLAAERRGFGENRRLAEALNEVPGWIATTLHNEPAVLAVAEQIHEARSALFVARGALFPIALEGALKLKETSYIHAEGFAAGELKHGPIALVDRTTPVIALAGTGDVFAKTASNIREIASRNGRLVILGDRQALLSLSDVATHAITIPHCDEFVQPILATVPLQLLAYHVALLRGVDVDRPRNLAKSVTVE